MNAPLTDVGQIPMSPALAATLARAADAAKARRLPRVTLEHVLLSLCDDPDGQAVLDASRLDVLRLRWDVARFVDGFAPPSNQPPSSEPLAVAEDVSRILEAAGAAARGGRRKDIDGAIVLAAIVGDGQSHAARILEAHGLTFDAAIRALQQAISRRTPPPPIRPSEPYGTEDVLARARERIQARTTPTLSDLMPRPQAMPQAVPEAMPEAVPEAMPQPVPFPEGQAFTDAPDFQSVAPTPDAFDAPPPSDLIADREVTGDATSEHDRGPMGHHSPSPVDDLADVARSDSGDDVSADAATTPNVAVAPHLPGVPDPASVAAPAAAPSASSDVPRLGTLPGWPDRSASPQPTHNPAHLDAAPAATRVDAGARDPAVGTEITHEEHEPPRHMPMLTDAPKPKLTPPETTVAPSSQLARDVSAARPQPQEQPMSLEIPVRSAAPAAAPRNEALASPAAPPPLPSLGASGVATPVPPFDPFAFSAGAAVGPSTASTTAAIPGYGSGAGMSAPASPPEWESHGPHVLSVQPAAPAPSGPFAMSPAQGAGQSSAQGLGQGPLAADDHLRSLAPWPSHDAGPPPQNGYAQSRQPAPQPAPQAPARTPDRTHEAAHHPERAARTIPVGKLLARVPRKMRVGRIKPVNIRLPIAAINDALRPYQTRPKAASGFAVRLYAPDGGVYVTGDTDMIYWPGSVVHDGGEPQDHVTWHFQVVPVERGQIPLTMVLRAIAATGNGGIDEYDVGDDTTYVNVRSNLKRVTMKFFGWLVAFGLGIALGRYVDGFWAALHASAPSLIPPPP